MTIAKITGQDTPDNRPAVTPEVHLSLGQSWRSNDFPNWSIFGLSPAGTTALRVSSIGTPTFKPGPLSNAAGIQLSGSILGLQTYVGTDTFAIGRAAVLAYQLASIRDGHIPTTPTIEFCASFPGSTWHSGGGGGLSPGGGFTASVSSDLMTVTEVDDDVVLALNQTVSATGITAGTRIIGFGTGTGNTGTYNLGIPQTVLSETMTGGTVGSSNFVGSIGTGTPSTILNVDHVNSGTIVQNQVLTGTSVLAGTTVLAYGTLGTTGTGGAGTYALEVGSAQTVSSRSFTASSTSWSNMLTIISQLDALTWPRLIFGTPLKVNAPDYTSFGYTQGGAADSTQAGKLADLADLFVQLDAVKPNMVGYFGLPSAISTATTFDVSEYGTAVFCRTNAPGAGGPYSGRAYFTSCSYPWQFNGGDNIHTGDYGSARWGEWEGYVRKLVKVDGVAWTPLWRPLSGGAITVSGQVITVPWARPAGPDFAKGVLSFQNNAVDGIKDWPNHGFNVKRGASTLTITGVAISGLNVLLTISETLSHADSLEVSYAWYGPGGTNPGLNSGVGGNLVMTGPQSLLYPTGYSNGGTATLDAWAVPFIENITA